MTGIKLVAPALGLGLILCGATASAAVAAGEPRYQQQQSPQGIGDSSSGEMNAGYNPKTGRYLLLHSLRTMRVTLAENLDDAAEPPLKLPENCPALWEDVSFDTTSVETLDPILSTDPQTGRSFVSQLIVAGGDSLYAYTDNDGDTWTPGTLTVTGGHDHQTLVSGPYAAGQGPLPLGDYPNVVTYCSSEPVAFSACARSDDGGQTFGPPVIASAPHGCNSSFFGWLGHLRYGADGTIYLPNKDCNGQQVVLVSEDSGLSYQVRPNPHATPPPGLGSPGSVAPAADGKTLYHCYQNDLGEVRVSVSHDQARSWISDTNLTQLAGTVSGVFPAIVAGDADRASCAFVGTTEPGNPGAADFLGVWHVYFATTYDGGQTWTTVNATPDNPVQGVGGICTDGFSCSGSNRNLLDFNELVLDARGYPFYAYDDGCLGLCDTDPVAAPTFVAKAAFVRQSGGRGLFAQFDPTEPAAPHRTCLSGTRNAVESKLSWPGADPGGDTISGYRIYRGNSLANLQPIASLGAVHEFVDTDADQDTAYVYKVSAVNRNGEAQPSNAITLAPSDALPDAPCQPLRVLTDGTGDTADQQDAHDFEWLDVTEPADRPGQIVFTLKMRSLATVPPHTLIALRLRSPTPPANGDSDYFVGLTYDGAAFSFVYGTYNSEQGLVGVYTTGGPLDSSSALDPDGHITLVADQALFGELKPGDALSALLAVSRATTPGAAGTTAGYSMDTMEGGAYRLTGTASCTAVAAGKLTTPAPATRSRFGGSYSAGAVVPLLILLIVRRRQTAGSRS